MASPLTKRALQTISDSGFARAKKLADLAIKTNTDSSGKTLARGYEQAIEILTPYTVSDGNDGIDAQRIVAGYNNSFTKLQNTRNKTNRTVGQFKIDENEIFFVTPTSGNRADIMRDIPSMVSQISDELSLHTFAVENAIEEAKANGESADELETYLMSVSKRQRMMLELNNDLLNGEISDESVLNGYGLYVDADPNDGELLGVSVAPLYDLPPGIESSNFARVDSSVAFGGGYIPVLGRVTTDGLGMKTVKIGNKVWDGTGSEELQFNKKLSNEQQFENNPGDFNLTSVTDKGVGMRPGSFSKGYTGFDAEGNPKETIFYAGKDGKVYTLDDEALSTFKNDPMIDSGIKKATRVDSSFAKNLLTTESVKPLRFSPFNPRPAHNEPNIDSTGTALQPVASPASFFEGKNTPTPPKEPVISSSTPDIVEEGKSFFRNVGDKVGGFFASRF